MRMSGCPCLTRRQFRRDPTDALFADQSQSILDNLVALLRRSRAWNCSVGTAAVMSGISRHSFQGNLKQVGGELGVRYVLEGSVRKAGQRVRITGQLIDALTGTHPWADRFDGSLENIFELQ